MYNMSGTLGVLVVDVLERHVNFSLLHALSVFKLHFNFYRESTVCILLKINYFGTTPQIDLFFLQQQMQVGMFG